MGRQVQGKFDQGWDKLREETFARRRNWRHPAGLKLTPSHKEIPAWDACPKTLKPVIAHGRWKCMQASWNTSIIMSDACSMHWKESRYLNNTLIFYIIGDNGASAEGTLNGTYNEMINFNGMSAMERQNSFRPGIDELGGTKSYNHYAVGWAHADEYTLPMDETSGLPLRRHPQRNDRALAQRHQGQG